jgi:hypothetical protein
MLRPRPTDRPRACGPLDCQLGWMRCVLRRRTEGAQARTSRQGPLIPTPTSDKAAAPEASQSPPDHGQVGERGKEMIEGAAHHFRSPSPRCAPPLRRPPRRLAEPAAQRRRRGPPRAAKGKCFECEVSIHPVARTRHARAPGVCSNASEALTRWGWRWQP